MLVNINMFSLILDFVGENPIIFNFIRIPRFGPFYNIYIYNLNSVLYCLLMFIFLLDKLYHIYAMLCLIFKNIIIFSIRLRITSSLSLLSEINYNKSFLIYYQDEVSLIKGFC